MNLAMKR